MTRQGLSLLQRYENTGLLAELEEAIKSLGKGNGLIPDDYPYKSGPLGNLGISYLRRFERLGDIVDLDEAITTQQQAVRLTPDDHPDKPGRLNNLGTSFLRRCQHLGDLADLDEATAAQQQVVHLTSDGHLNKPRYLNNLGKAFLCRFERLGDIADLDDAITTEQQAVHLTPDGHPHQSMYLNDLGSAFCAQLAHHPDNVTLGQAISTYSRSARSISGSPSVRFTAAHMWATLCSSDHSNETFDAYSTLLELLPRMVWLGRTVEQRHNDISIISDAVPNAAAAAIRRGKFDLALEWLEQGRSVVWGQMLQPLDQLRRHCPNEAQELEKISHALESAHMVQYPAHSDTTTSQTLEEAARAHRRLADAYDRIVRRIRDLPNFEDFLRPRNSASLCSAAISGPVVIVNAHTTRCDALILRPHSSQVYHVALPGFQASAALEVQTRLVGLTRGFMGDAYSEDDSAGSLSDILGQLWLHVVEPILSYLGVSRLLFLRSPR